ncbi:MAG TPA: hypothetical protein VNN80_00475, partial [Polyangiaceae bacterium]|nr:hypothetical protein [Polyangiaceae bacterium]
MLVGWMTWASTSRARSQRASQKPSRPASKATARRVMAHPAFRLVPPAMQEAERGVLVGLELLERVALEAGHDPGDEPARAAQLDDGDQRAVLLEGDEGPAQVVALRHGAPHRLFPAAMVLRLRRLPHSFFNRRTAKRISHGFARL